MVELTFDDGPDQDWTPAVAAALTRAGVQARFFVMALRASANADVIAELRAGGHDIGLHCLRHLRHPGRSRAAVEADTAAGLALLADLDVHPVYWRVPYGAYAPWTEEVADRFGLRLQRWTVDTEDWRRGRNASVMLADATRALRPDSVVLMHDGVSAPRHSRGGAHATVALIEPLVEFARRRGWQVGLSREPEALAH